MDHVFRRLSFFLVAHWLSGRSGKEKKKKNKGVPDLLMFHDPFIGEIRLHEGD